MAYKSTRWLGINWYSGKSGVLAYVTEQRNLNSPDNVIISSHTSKFRRFAHIPSELLTGILDKDHGIYEIIEHNRKRRVYFDIDHSDASLSDISDVIIKHFPNAQLNISGNKSVGSYHIVLQNYYYDTIKEQQELKSWLSSKECASLGFDNKVYGRNQQFKCIGQSKPGKQVQSYISGSKLIDDHLVCNVPSGLINALSDNEYLPVHLCNVNILRVPQQKQKIRSHIDFTEYNPLDLINLVRNPIRGTDSLPHAITHMVMCYAVHNGVSFQDFWNWAKAKDDSQARYNKYCVEWQSPAYIPKSSNMKALLLRTYPGIDKPAWINKMKEGMQFKADSLTPERWLNYKDIPECRYVALAHGTGGNKTGAVIEYISINNLSFIWITPRITLAQNTIGRIREAGINCDTYLEFNSKDKKDKMPKSKCLLIGAHSLHHIQDYDISGSLVVIDESELVMKDWFNNMDRERIHDHWNILQRLLRECNKCIVMDAFFSRLTLDYIGEISGGRLHVVNRPAYQRDVTISEIQSSSKKTKGKKSLEQSNNDLQAWILHISSSIKSGKKCFVFYPFNRSSNSHEGIQVIRDTIIREAEIQPSDALCYFAETDDIILSGLKKVNESWSKVKLVITNSKITVGVNYELLDYDLVYICKSIFICPRDISQVIARIRHIKDKQIYMVYLTGKGQHYFPKASINDSLWTKLVDNYKIENRSGTRELQNYLFKLAGYKISTKSVIQEISNDAFQYLHDSDMAFDYELIYNIRDEAHCEEVQEKCYTDEATMDDKLAIAKYRFKGLFREGTPEEGLHRIWSDRHTQLAMRHIEYLRCLALHPINDICVDLGLRRVDQEWDYKRKLSNSCKDRLSSTYYLGLSKDSDDRKYVSSYLNAYYNTVVYSYDPVEKSWDFSNSYLDNIKFIEEHCGRSNIPNFNLLI
jgi:hypothetical protein